jgi:glyoxylase-like metal-dependent hydrolase (beta-lactamase superfamily II)
MRARKAAVHRKFGPVGNGYHDSYVVEHFVPLFANLTTRWFFPNAKWCSQDPLISFRLTTPTVYGCLSQAEGQPRDGQKTAMSDGFNLAVQAGEISFDRSFFGAPGKLVRLSPLVRRIVAGNAGPMTFTGTCTYVVGTGEVAIIDPGPDRPDHITALLAALHDETITAIYVTHTHKDHSPGARALKAATGARILGCAPYDFTSRAAGNPIDAAHDSGYAPDTILRDGDAIEGKNFSLTCVETPGHAMNHQAFALPQENALFSGDHVMAWSTSVVVPPDGAMRHYMASLTKLLTRDDKIYWPGHGGPVMEPQSFVRALIQHRRGREKSILSRLSAGDTTVPLIVANVYKGLNPALTGAAALSVLAHLEDLVERGLVITEGALALGGIYRPA